MDLKKLEKNVRERGFEFFYAATAEEAVQHVLDQVRNTSVGIGGSTTVDQLGLYDRLTETNQVHWHWKDGPKPEVYQAAAEAEMAAQAQAQAQQAQAAAASSSGGGSQSGGGKGDYLIQ